MMKFILKHKLKLIIIIFFIVGAVLGNALDLTKMYYGYDRVSYVENLKQIQENEKEAVDILSNIDFKEIEYSINEVNNAKDLWLDNSRIARNLGVIPKISWHERQTSEELIGYMRLRIHQCVYLVKKLKQGKAYDDKQLEDLENEIAKYLQDNPDLFVIE